MTNVRWSLVAGVTILIGIAAHAPSQTGVDKRVPWLRPYTPTRLEWLALQKQAMEGHKDFNENGVTVNFYLGPDSLRTGEMLCDLDLPTTSAQLVQVIENGILKRFEASRQVDSWARVKIIKKVALAK